MAKGGDVSCVGALACVLRWIVVCPLRTTGRVRFLRFYRLIPRFASIVSDSVQSVCTVGVTELDSWSAGAMREFW